MRTVETNLLELIAAVGGRCDDDLAVAATVRHLLRRGHAQPAAGFRTVEAPGSRRLVRV